jgi:hypothetical protein
MSGNRTGLALASALVTSVALAAPGLAQDAATTSFTLSGTGGVIGIGVPSFDTGAFGHSAGGVLFGGMVGGNITAGVADGADYDVFVSLSAFGAFATGGTSSWTDTFNGPGTIIITGLSAPDAGSITLDPAVSSANVTGANGGIANTTAAVGAVNNVGAVTPDAPGFAMSAVTTDATAGAAYGGIGDDSGGIFIASGNYEGLQITTSVSRQVLYGGADLSLGLAGQTSDTTSVQVYAGPSFRGLVQTNTTRISVNIPEEQPSTVILPEFALSHVDELTSHYFGGVIGGNVAIVGSESVLYSIGLEGGVYSVHANWRGQDTYSTCCGVDGVGVASPAISVSSNALTANVGSAVAFAARGNASVSYALDANKAVTVGGSVEYLSHVAQVNHSGLTQTAPADDDWTAAEGTPATSTFSWSHMLNFTATVSLTGTF